MRSRCLCVSSLSDFGAQYGEESALAVVSLAPSIALGVRRNDIWCAVSRSAQCADKGPADGDENSWVAQTVYGFHAVRALVRYRSGDFTVLVGPSGCGKTLLRWY